MNIESKSNYSKSDRRSVPLVSILMAVYNPNYDWFKEQLRSLNNQTYENLELIIYDDCPDKPLNEDVVKDIIKSFNYKIIRGEKNRGSNKAFEYLTQVGKGEFFSYCDQDDIWEKDKIKIMMQKFNKNVMLVCCDLSIINKNGVKTHESITEIRKRIVYKRGCNLAEDLLVTNFVTGCAMIVRKEIAQSAIPFETSILHDQWIAIIAALNGEIEVVNKSLIRYRQHDNNQSGILKGVYDKNSYFEKRIKGYLSRYYSFKNRFAYNEEFEKRINEMIIWLKARERYYIKPSIKNLKIMLKYKKFHKMSIYLEIILPFIPNCSFKVFLKAAKNGLI